VLFASKPKRIKSRRKSKKERNGTFLSLQLEIVKELLQKKDNNKKITACLVEPTSYDNIGSIGAYYIKHWAEEAGAEVDIITYDSAKTGYDLELVSVHYYRDYWKLIQMPKRARIRIIGGHVTYCNPKPLIPFADYICVGDGETWIYNAVKGFIKNKDYDFSNLPGTINCSNYNGSIPKLNIEDPIPENPPYLNHPNTNNSRWYIELARGCPYRCAFCELGNTVPYRYKNKKTVLKTIMRADKSKSNRIHLFAPDEASYKYYNEIMEYCNNNSYNQATGSYRISQILRKGLEIGKDQLIRVGIDGLTDKTRCKINKKLNKKQIKNFFEYLIKEGYKNVRLFLIYGYPWDTRDDFLDFANLIERYIGKIYIEIKWTHFVPLPCTPIGGKKIKFNNELYNIIKKWHKRFYRKGLYLYGLSGKKSFQESMDLAHANENYLFSKATGYINERWKK
jgi:radical SAM superfamily enzyme YgiQ (UPF0313 family)